MIRCIDAIDEEKRHMWDKLKYHTDANNMQVRDNIKGLIKIASACEYYYRTNHNRQRDCKIN